ncbi:hypothetical protein ABLE94_13180 [Gordonia sp. VNK1]|jgi:hypothetical protein|uniref:hypothetical protein n=1 Tax=Gordonia oleivorans TaxID=3156618 RepID=UPI0032B4EF3F
MSKKYVLLLVGAAVAAVSTTVGAVILLRRSRTEIPPVSATVPRVEDFARDDAVDSVAPDAGAQTPDISTDGSANGSAEAS